VEYYTAAALARVGDSLARGASTGRVLRGRATYQYLQIRRARSGVPEVHDRWTDVTVVQSGRATLLSGGRVSGSHVEGAGEHRGGTIAGGSSRPVAGGDLMIIPAGIPHQYLVAAGDSLRYLTVKVLEPAAGH
jgi:mannose-6-phosphate isomerase-like protein (cupin superfamily)